MRDQPADPGSSLDQFLAERLVIHGYALDAAPEALARALVRFQSDTGRDATGALDADTWTALLGSPGPRLTPLTFFGEPDLPDAATEAWPGEALLRLRALGFALNAAGADLAEAVRRFQDLALLSPTGELDVETLWALRCATSEVGPLVRFAPDWSLVDSGAPLVFGLESRDVAGDGGYRYRQYSDGAIQILRSPQGKTSDALLRSGPAWAAISAEIGPWPSASGSLVEGARGDDVRALQLRLNELGFGPLDDDGVFGALTATGLRRFQSAVGLPSNGQLDGTTRARLAAPWPTLRAGAQGEEVRACQRSLQNAGAPIQGIDGSFGPETEGAVRVYQQRVGLPVTGEFDERTRGHLLGAELQMAPFPKERHHEVVRGVAARARLPPQPDGTAEAERVLPAQHVRHHERGDPVLVGEPATSSGP